MYGHQPYLAIDVIPHVPGWLTRISPMRASRKTLRNFLVNAEASGYHIQFTPVLVYVQVYFLQSLLLIVQDAIAHLF